MTYDTVVYVIDSNVLFIWVEPVEMFMTYRAIGYKCPGKKSD